MRDLFAYALLICMAALSSLVAQEKKAPTAPLVFAAKNGPVTYDHAAHAKRENNGCKSCHPAVFAQDAKAPLNFKPAMHKTPEANKTSCGFCHHAAGKAFETKANCTTKCHGKAPAAKG